MLHVLIHHGRMRGSTHPTTGDANSHCHTESRHKGRSPSSNGPWICTPIRTLSLTPGGPRVQPPRRAVRKHLRSVSLLQEPVIWTPIRALSPGPGGLHTQPPRRSVSQRRRGFEPSPISGRTAHSATTPHGESPRPGAANGRTRLELCPSPGRTACSATTPLLITGFEPCPSHQTYSALSHHATR